MVEQCCNDAQDLEEAGTVLATTMGLSDADVSQREDVRVRIQSLVQQTDPHAAVALFGSSVTGLGTRGGDVDVCVETDCDCSLSVEALARQFRDCGWPLVSTAASAKCPVMRCRAPKTSLFCEISINNRYACVRL